MKINELEKIIKDNLIKYRVFKDADLALEEIRGIIRAKDDLKKDIASLTKEANLLKEDISLLSAQKNKALQDEQDIITRARLEAESLKKAAEHEIYTNKTNAEISLKNLLDKIKQQEEKAGAAEKAATEAHEKLVAINKELEESKERARKLLV